MTEPKISEITPNSGQVGTTITITGTGFGNNQGYVLFGTTEANVISWSDTQVVVAVPGSLSTGSVQVAVKAGELASNAVTFTITSGIGGGGGGGGGGGNISNIPPSHVETPPADSGEPATISSSGGTVKAAGEQVSLRFLPGAVQDDVQVTVSQVVDAPFLLSGHPLQTVSPVFEFNAGGAKFSKPIIARIKYNAEQLKGTDPRMLGIYREDAPNQWSYKGGKVNRSANSVKTELPSFSKYAVMAYNKSFSDTVNHWAENDIKILAARHVVNGVSPTEFKPDASITRAQFATMLVNALKLYTPQGVTPSFKDVKPGDWFFNSVEAAARAGLVEGKDNNCFVPNAPVTRQEAAAMLLRAAGLNAELGAAAFDKLPFRDKLQIAGWARGAVATAYRSGLISGISKTQFAPDQITTRAQAAALVVRMMESKGLMEATASVEGMLQVSNIEGKHYELISGTITYELALNQANVILLEQIEARLGTKVMIEGYLHTGPTARQRGPILKVLKIY